MWKRQKIQKMLRLVINSFQNVSGFLTPTRKFKGYYPLVTKIDKIRLISVCFFSQIFQIFEIWKI